MQYLGGKSRLAKKIVKVLQDLAPETLGVVEPFMGGGAVTEQLCKWRPTLASDGFRGLAGMYEAIRAGLRLDPEGVTDEQYQQLRDRALAGDRSPEVVAVGFGLSFGGKWYGGNRRVKHDGSRDSANYFNNWADRFCKLERLWIDECDYADRLAIARPGLLYYCDPPYAGTEGYSTGPFDHGAFYLFCRRCALAGARVFVSEYSMPDGLAVEVASFRKDESLNRGIAGKGSAKYVEDRLFEVLQ